MNKTITILPCILAILCIMLFMEPISAEEDTIDIVCTNAVLADFTSHLIMDNVSIEFIMPAGACPSHFDTVPSDVVKIVNADIIISLGWEPWLESLLNKSGNTAYTEIPCGRLGEWSIPSGAIRYIQAISHGLQETFPEKKQDIQQNTKDYLETVNETSEQLQEKIISLHMEGRMVLSMQWHSDFLEWLGLNVTHSYGPPEGLSVQDELDAMSAAEKEGVTAVIDNLQSGTEFGAHIASESGLSHVIFTNFPGAVPNTDTYLEMISYNADQLISGINSFDYTSEQTKTIQNTLDEIQFQRNLFVVTTVIMLLLCMIMYILYRRK